MAFYTNKTSHDNKRSHINEPFTLILLSAKSLTVVHNYVELAMDLQKRQENISGSSWNLNPVIFFFFLFQFSTLSV